MKLLVEECLVTNYGVSCIKPSFYNPPFFVNMLNNNANILSKILTNEYIFGYICFRGCEFIINDFLSNKEIILNSNSSYEYLFDSL